MQMTENTAFFVVFYIIAKFRTWRCTFMLINLLLQVYRCMELTWHTYWQWLHWQTQC